MYEKVHLRFKLLAITAWEAIKTYADHLGKNDSCWISCL